MTRAIIYSPEAESDLGDIWDYTAHKWSKAQSESYVRGLGKTLQTLADFPEIARLRREFSKPVRVHTYRSHVIIYIEQQDRLDILRLLYNRTNWQAILAE